MNLLFKYYFGGKPIEFNGHSDSTDEKEFEYEADYDEAIDYLIRTHGTDDLIKDYIDNKFYENESDENKDILRSYDGFDGTYDSIENMSEENKIDMIKEVFFEVIADGESDLYYDELKDYFEQEAYDAFDDENSDNYYSYHRYAEALSDNSFEDEDDDTIDQIYMFLEDAAQETGAYTYNDIIKIDPNDQDTINKMLKFMYRYMAAADDNNESKCNKIGEEVAKFMSSKK